MKTLRRILVGLTFLLAVAVLPVSAGKEKGSSVCQFCGMDASKSETEFVLSRKTGSDMNACCINCARRIIKKLGAEVTNVTALDYRTRKQVIAADAFYVLGSTRVPKGSMMPFVFTFGTRADADEFKDRQGGEVLSFKEVMEKLSTNH